MRRLAHVRLSEMSFYRIGGPADTILELTSISDMHEALAYLRRHAPSAILPLGSGSNVLAPDDGYRGTILWLRPGRDGFMYHGDGHVSVYAGNAVDQLVHYALGHRLSGLAWAAGLPGSIGGAIRGNAGAFGSEIRDSVMSVHAIDLRQPSMGMRTLERDACQFAYHDSLFKRKSTLLIVSADFALLSASGREMEEQRELYHRNLSYRARHHPIDLPSCGSVYKNITDGTLIRRVLAAWPDSERMVVAFWHGKIPMAYSIGRLGFAGYRVGEAQVSERHANYIVNLGHARAVDVVAIIAAIRERCMAVLGFAPELEVEVIRQVAERPTGIAPA